MQPFGDSAISYVTQVEVEADTNVKLQNFA